MTVIGSLFCGLGLPKSKPALSRGFGVLGRAGLDLPVFRCWEVERFLTCKPVSRCWDVERSELASQFLGVGRSNLLNLQARAKEVTFLSCGLHGLGGMQL